MVHSIAYGTRSNMYMCIYVYAFCVADGQGTENSAFQKYHIRKPEKY